MRQTSRAQRIDQISEEALAVLGSGRQVAPYSARYPEFELAEAYQVASRVCDLRRARGETPVGRKMGFTNSEVQRKYGIAGPIWNYMFDSTVRNIAEVDGSFSLTGLAEPLIEPEIALHIAREPNPDMGEDELIGCVDWVAHGFEIVHSIFPRWAFAAADAVAGFGLHGAYFLGERRSIADQPGEWANALSSFTLDLACQGVIRRGRATNVLGGPVKALGFLVGELDHAGERLHPGEVVTTGTLTEAMPAVAGQTWSTTLNGISLKGLKLSFR
jgi:2-oxo-3-hexenedioate decarboxylase